MKVLNLRCTHHHAFEGWFGSEEDFLDQNARKAIECPMCADKSISRLPSAPRLNLSGAREPVQPAADKSTAVAKPAAAPAELSPADMQALWLQAVEHVLQNTEDVGDHFPEEARRIHYGESEHRGIRGQATPDERAALADEGIEVMALPLPAGLKGPAH